MSAVLAPPLALVSSAPSELRLLNRERAILEFNRRVLAQAEREDVPLLERLRYICIVSSNLDEFFEVRFGDYIEATRLPGAGVSSRDLAEVAAAAHELIDQQYALFNDGVMPALTKEGIVILSHAQRNADQVAWVDQFFQRQVRPLLVPVGLDPAHPFPQVANKSLNFIVKLGGRDAFGRANSIAIVKVPRVLPRVIRLPAKLADGQQAFVLLSSVIRAHLEELFPGRTVESFSQFRVTRDSDLAVDDEDVTNLRQALRTSLTTRHFGQAIRLEVVSSCPPELSEFLLHQFGLPDAALYRANGPVNLVRLNQLIDQADAPHLRFSSFEPAWPASLPRQVSMFERLRHGDVLLHHPFESFEPVVQLLREAVRDPDVLAIKQTIYRTGAESVLMDLLLEAASRGKEVTAVVELKARFDEEANINWAEQLEAVGAQVVYGIVGLKTHAKLLLVTRREQGSRGPMLRRYAHLSTGNYNHKTARLYTDVGYLTADRRAHRRCRHGVPAAREPDQGAQPAPAPDGPLQPAQADGAAYRGGGRCGPCGAAGAHRGQGQCVDRSSADRGAGPCGPGRCAHRPRRARRLHAAARHQGADGPHPRAFDRGTLPRALARAVLLLGAGARR